MVLYVLNAAVITSTGKYDVKKITREGAIRKLKGARKVVSAVGHPGSASFLTQVLKYKIPTNRVMVKMRKGDEAIVLKLKSRLPEGKVLSEKELKKYPYELWLVKKVG